jgi:hypothetical protein
MGKLFRKRLSIFLIANALVALVAAGAFAQTAPTLAGVVRDSAGTPLADVEVILRDANAATRTNDRGEFSLSPRTAGAYNVWFRRLGFRSVEFSWHARADERTEIVVNLFPIPRRLDPVVVRAEEDRRAASRASLLGLVLDSSGTPIPEAEIQLVGADVAGTTRANGGFLFKPLAIGSYVLRARKLGYAPAMVTIQLLKGDDHEVVVYMRRLPANLEPFVVAERSGYGRDQAAYDELEKRKRWQSFQTRLFGPEDLKSFHGVDLGTATVRMGLGGPLSSIASQQVRSINGGGRRISSSGRGPAAESGYACVLLNGTEGIYTKLSLYSTDEIEMLEVYPSRTELSGTVSGHFHDPHCTTMSLQDHPMYYVLWFRNR